jgi:hypothetical protein
MRPARGELTPDHLAPWLFGESAWPRLVFVNGRFAPALSRVDALDGITLMSLAVALREEPSLLERHLTRQADTDDPAQVFAAINTALMHDGAVIHVQRGVTARTPIHLLFLSDADAAGGSSQPRVLLVVEPESQATIVEQYASAGGSRYFTNAVTEAWVGDGATLNHFRLQQEARDAFRRDHGRPPGAGLALRIILVRNRRGPVEDQCLRRPARPGLRGDAERALHARWVAALRSPDSHRALRAKLLQPRALQGRAG